MDAIYARQSIDKKGSLSIEGQIELCRKFTVDDALVFSDKGFSGKNTKRPAFGELMEAVEAGRVKKRRVPARPLQPLPRGFQPDLGASA